MQTLQGAVKLMINPKQIGWVISLGPALEMCHFLHLYEFCTYSGFTLFLLLSRMLEKLGNQFYFATSH